MNPNLRVPFPIALGVIIVAMIIAVILVDFPGLYRRPRVRVSRVQSDVRTLATALEAYFVDHGAYPPVRDLHRITTPVAYLTYLAADPYADSISWHFRYQTNGTSFIVGSFGPDRDEATGGDLPWSDAEAMNALLADQTRLLPYTYNPTNGTFSEGDIWRIGGKDPATP